MNTVSRIKTAAKAWVAILALSLILLPGTAMASAGNGTGSPASGWQQIITSVADFLQPVTDWFLTVTGFGTRAAGEGTGQREASSGTGLGTKDAGNGTG